MKYKFFPNREKKVFYCYNTLGWDNKLTENKKDKKFREWSGKKAIIYFFVLNRTFMKSQTPSREWWVDGLI